MHEEWKGVEGMPEGKWGTRQKCGWKVGEEGVSGLMGERVLAAVKDRLKSLYTDPWSQPTGQTAETGMHATDASEKLLLCSLPFPVSPRISAALPLPSLRDSAGVTTATHPPHHFRCGLGPLLSVGPQSSPLSPIFLHWVLRLSSPDPCFCSKQQWPPLDPKSEILVLKRASMYTCWCVSRQLKNQCKPRIFRRTIGWEEDGTQS